MESNHRFNHLVSVIIPVYNGEQFLAEAIKSVLSQSYHSTELIVVDDGSNDHTGEIISSFPSVIHLYQANAGIGAARNLGIQASKGEYLAFLDADDLWLPEKLSLQMAAFESDPSLEIVSGLIEQFVDTGMEASLARRFSIASKPLPGYLSIAILIKRSTLDALGMFHENFQFGETISWFADVIDRQMKILVLPNLVARRRIHGKNNSLENPQEKNREIIRVLKISIDRKRLRGTSQEPL